MTIDKETRAEILRLYHAEKWWIGTIARHFSVHYTTVDRVLTDDGVPLQYRRRRRSKLDPFLPFIRQTLAVWPKLPASRLYEMVRERGYARFALNDYSVPHTHVSRTLVVAATLEEVRILDGAEVIASHPRSFDKVARIEIPDHIADLTKRKRHARRLRGQDRLFGAAPNSERLLADAATRGSNLGAIVAALLRLLDDYGAAELEVAIDEALERGVPHPNAVRLSLTRRREQREQPPPIPVELSKDPRLASHQNPVRAHRHHGSARHGTYIRKTPRGVRVARGYCPQSRTTFSLLPDCLAARLPGTFEALAAVVVHAESASSLEAAANELRRDAVTCPAPCAGSGAGCALSIMSWPWSQARCPNCSGPVLPEWAPCAHIS